MYLLNSLLYKLSDITSDKCIEDVEHTPFNDVVNIRYVTFCNIEEYFVDSLMLRNFVLLGFAPNLETKIN